VTCRCPTHPIKSPCMVSIHLLPQEHARQYSSFFTVTYSNNKPSTWVAHVNNTQSSQLAFAATGTTSSTTNLLCLKKGNTVTNPVAFTGMDAITSLSSDSGTITDVWSLYGAYVLLSQPNGNFYAKSTGQNGWWQLMWSTSQRAASEATPLALKTNPPVFS